MKQIPNHIDPAHLKKLRIISCLSQALSNPILQILHHCMTQGCYHEFYGTRIQVTVYLSQSYSFTALKHDTYTFMTLIENVKERKFSTDSVSILDCQTKLHLAP